MSEAACLMCAYLVMRNSWLPAHCEGFLTLLAIPYSSFSLGPGSSVQGIYVITRASYL